MYSAAATQAYATGGATAIASASQFSYPGYHHQQAPAPYGQQQYQQAVPYQQRGPQYSASANSYYYNNYDNGYSNYDNAYK